MAGILERVKMWRYGVCRVSKEKLGRMKNVDLVRFIPSKVGLNNLKIMNDVLNVLYRRKSTYSIEIWSENGEVNYYVHASKREDLEEFLLRLNTVYPSSKMEFGKYSTPEFNGYISGGYLVLKGQEFWLKTLDDFDYDPLVHVIEAIDTPYIIQVLFKPARYIVEKLQGKFPVFKCRIAVVTCSDDIIKARKACESILNSFSVFNTHISQLEPRIISFPIFRSSLSLLRGIMRRRFPLFSKNFLVTSKELAGYAHFYCDKSTSGRI